MVFTQLRGSYLLGILPSRKNLQFFLSSGVPPGEQGQFLVSLSFNLQFFEFRGPAQKIWSIFSLVKLSLQFSSSSTSNIGDALPSLGFSDSISLGSALPNFMLKASSLGDALPSVSHLSSSLGDALPSLSNLSSPLVDSLPNLDLSGYSFRRRTSQFGSFRFYFQQTHLQVKFSWFY